MSKRLRLDKDVPECNAPAKPKAAGEVWQKPDLVAQSQIILDSYRRWLGRELLQRSGDIVQDAEALFHHGAIVVSHTPAADPILNYANQAALVLWEMTIDEFVRTPSRLTAEPVHRDERAQLLARTTRDGFVDDYRGIRVSKSGRRFRIEQAIVFNLISSSGQFAGQSATFSQYEYLDD